MIQFTRSKEAASPEVCHQRQQKFRKLEPIITEVA
jgi:hypothetical protein